MKNYVWGIFLVVIGIIIGLNALDITNINIFFNGWWTLFLIIPSLSELVRGRKKSLNIIGLCLGVFLLLTCNGIIDIRLLWKLLIPVSLIVVGINIISKGTKKEIRKKIKSNKKPEVVEHYATFGKKIVSFDKKTFDGAEVNAVFGSFTLDLSKAKIKDECVLIADSIFGNVTLIIPNDIKVMVSDNSLFGDIDDERKNISDNPKKTIYLDTLVIFGGIKIK